MATPNFSALLPDNVLAQIDELGAVYGTNKTQTVIRAIQEQLTKVKLVNNNNSLYVGDSGEVLRGYAIRPTQLQRIAQANSLESHSTYGQHQDMTGLKVTLYSLRDNPNDGWFALIPQLEAMAARVGATIQHPGNESEIEAFRVEPRKWSLNSYFVYPAQ